MDMPCQQSDSPKPLHKPQKAAKRSTSHTTTAPAADTAPVGIHPRLFRVLNEANAPALAVDVAGHVTFWNQKLTQLSGLRAADVLGRPLAKLVTAPKTTQLTRALEQALTDVDSTVRDVEIELNTPELGRNLKLLVNLTVDVDDNRVSSVVAVGQDVTVWQLQGSQYARVAQQANAPIVELDRDGNVILWNPKAEALTGYSIEQVMGTPLVNLVHEDFRVLVGELLGRVALTNTSVSEFELPMKTASGARVELLLSLTPQVSVDGAGTTVNRIVAIGQDVTARNASEMEYSKLVDSANAPIFGVDTEGCVVIFNKKAAQISEYWPGEVMGVDLVSFLIHEDYREEVSAVFQKALQGFETANFEFPLITKHGRKVEILLNATPRYNHDGAIVGVVGIGQDITERIVQEQEYSRLIDTANAPIVGVDKKFRVTIWNKKAATITDYSYVQAIGKDLLGFIAEHARDTVADVLAKAMGGVETANFEFPLVTKSGRQLDILLNATPRFDHSGTITGVVGIGQDFTDQRAQEEEYIRLIDTANAPIFGIDMEGRVDIWNRKAVAITEYTVIEARGTRLVESFIPHDYRAGVSDVMSKAMEGEGTANFEFPLITKTGRRVDILLNATPRYNQHGDIVGVVGIGQDITERIVQEQEYSRLIDTANAPIFGVDMTGLVNIWNDKSAEITQFPAEEVLGKDLVQEFISEGYRSAVGLVLSQALNGVQTANFNFPLITKSGRRVEILLNATPRYNELGEIVGVVSIGQDITERIAQEQEYSRLIDTANAPIFGVDSEGRVNIWNKKAAEIMQYSTDEVLGENLVDKFITEDYREAVGAVLSKALDGIETANFEFPLVTKAGRRVEILLNATPRFNEHGTVIGMVGIGQDITDRIAQEQEYARLIEKANAPIFGVDSQGRINIWNRKTAEMTQFSKEEAENKDLMSWAVPEEYRDAVETILWKALEGDETSNFELELKKKNGRTVNIRMNATARFDQHGEIVGVVGIGQDLTDRIVQEQEYTRLIDTANAPIFGVDANLCVNIWNKKAAQITKYSTAEVIGENLVETFISPEYRPIVADVFSKALNGIQTANFEFPLITRPGTRIEILLNATPRNDMHGNIVGVVGIGQDITDRIAQEHEYFRLIDTANAPIFGVDTFGCINEWNQKIEEITGFHKSTVLGLSLVDAFINAENRPEVRKLLNQALIGIDVEEMELPMTTAAGLSLLLLVNASSKKDMHGNIRGVIGVGQDYTAKKHMEAAKVNFLASFSHELRTPLNGVLGMLELLRDQHLDKTPERYVHIAYISGSLLLNLINDILDLSKIEAGHMEISADPFQMQDLLEYSVEIFKFKAREKHIKLTLECSPKVPKRVVGDVSRLRQVLLNLLSNAIKFTNEGSITVKCNMVPSPDLPKHCVKLLFQVIDTGVGMDDEEKSRLFSLFTKLERTRKNNPTGSGLGLAICKQLVELMDGDIDVDSELGEGSEFFFTVVVRRLDDDEDDIIQKFPAVLAADASSAPSLAASNARNNASMSELVPKHARILVVEDNEFNWEVVKSFFMEDNHLLQWETNGLDAYQMYQEHHESYDIVLMDCEMPIMNGYDSTRNIRIFEKQHKLSRIPIIGVTAYAMSGDRKKCLDAGMDEFIVKPISKTELRKAIRKWMRVRFLGQHCTRQSVDAAGQDVACVSNQNAANLVAASRHKEKLDLDRAISDLELEDPMMIGQTGGIQTAAGSEALLMSLTTISESKSNQSASSGTLGRTIGPSDTQREMIDSTNATRPTNGAVVYPGHLVNASSIVGTNLFAAAKAAGIYHMDATEAAPNSSSSDDGSNQHDAGENATSSTIVANKPARAYSATMAPEDVVIPTGDPIDYSLGVEQCGENESLFVSLLEKYAGLSDEFMRRIEDAYSKGDFVVLRRESHSLKGSSAYVAAMRVSKASFRVQLATEHVMEETATAEDHTSLKDAFQLLKREHRALRGYLRRNFSFRTSTGNANQETKKKSGGGGDNACAVMRRRSSGGEERIDRALKSSMSAASSIAPRKSTQGSVQASKAVVVEMVGSPVRTGKGVPRYPPWLQKALKVKEETEQFWIKQQQLAEAQRQKQQRPKSRAPDLAATAQAARQSAERGNKSEPFVNVWVSIAADDAQAVKMFLEEDRRRFFLRKDFLRDASKGLEGNGGGDSLLHEASYVGSLKVMRFLISFMQTHFAPEICQEAVNVVDTQYSLTTPMIAACRNSLGAIANRVEILQLLVEAGGDTARSDSHGDNVLHWCARNSQVLLLRYFLKHTDAVVVALTAENYKRQTPLHVAKLQLQRSSCLSSLTVHELLLGVNPTCNLRLKMLGIRRNETHIRVRDAADVQEQLAAVMEASELLVPRAEKLWRETIELAERRRKTEEQQHVDAEVKAAGAAAREWLETKDGRLFVKKQIPLATADVKQAVYSGKMPKPKDYKAAATQRVQDLFCVEKEQSARKSATESFVAHRPPYPRDRVTELRRMLHL